MIKLVKYQNRNGGKVLISKFGEVDIQECGIMIKFPASDNRRPHYAVLMEKDAVQKMVDELLEYLKE